MGNLSHSVAVIDTINIYAKALMDTFLTTTGDGSNGTKIDIDDTTQIITIGDVAGSTKLVIDVINEKVSFFANGEGFRVAPNVTTVFSDLQVDGDLDNDADVNLGGGAFVYTSNVITMNKNIVTHGKISIEAGKSIFVEGSYYGASSTNGTKIDIDDTLQKITLTTGAVFLNSDVLINSGLLNNSFSTGTIRFGDWDFNRNGIQFEVDDVGRLVQFGDLDSVGNGVKFVLNDELDKATIIGDTIQTSGSIVQLHTFLAKIGDYTTSVNGTSLIIDDTTGNIDISSNVTNGVLTFGSASAYLKIEQNIGGINIMTLSIEDVPSGSVLNIKAIDGTVSIGDVNFDEGLSGARLVVKNALIEMQSSVVTMGDPQEGINGTTISVSNISQIIDLNAVNGVQVNGVKLLDFQEIVVSISESQIESLHTTPVEIVPAPGAGKIIEFISAFIFFDFISVAYDAGTVRFRYTGAAGDVATYGAIFNDTNDVYRAFSPSGGVMEVDTPLEIRLVSSVGTDGDGTAKIYVTYRIITL